jgi:twinkle protein
MTAQSSSKFLRHIPCTSCESSDAMALYEQEDGTVNATCFSCGHYEPNPERSSSGSTRQEEMPRSRRSEIKSTLSVEQISECPSLPIPDRGIKQYTSDFYGVKTILNGLDGKTPVAICFPYYKHIHNTYSITGYKKRLLEDKIFTSIGDTKDTLLFGQDKFLDGGKKLYITEGELDCLSLYQVLKDLAGAEWKHLDPCVVSLPHGALHAASALGNQREFLDLFQEIVLCFDQDEHGQGAVDAVCSFLDPSRVKIAHFSEKDPNDMLMKGKSSELKWAVLSHAKAYRRSYYIPIGAHRGSQAV